ncbi:MAG: ATP-binding cassette domain-containing protein [Treponema sp.]|uniref:methionine ABC transporter ATP-binding protein n=1 Tax=Treponema sp. TaxID=166 RepID=UPI0025EAED0D|nr:ATP-binding cassette domain-containing protein [Treponema sp.]MBQ8679707.1 ATP-binding cassette domain-containing protein [Treponema sp.]
MSDNTIIELKDITKTFVQDGKTFKAVEDASVSIEKGDIFGIIGFSGAGKSTLVRTINLLGRPTSGSVTVKGKDFLSLSAKDLREERKKIGMIFQHFNLMKSRNVFDNVAFPLKRSGLTRSEISEKVHSLLKLVEIDEKAANFPSQLSGGQKQRVAIARALTNEPDILLCDEATSALDPTTTKSILKLLKKLKDQLSLTIVIITHQMEVIKEICDKVAVMEKGRIVEQGDVFSIFANPQDEVTKRFIRSTSNLSKVEELIAEDSPVVRLEKDEKLVRFTYIKKNVSEPLISAISRLYEVTINIIFAEIEIVQDAPIGGTVAIVSGEAGTIDRALKHIAAMDVGVEVLKTGGKND